MDTGRDSRITDEAVVSWRRDFHRFPEPGFGEFRTASVVYDFLTRQGFRVRIAEEAMNKSVILDCDELRIAEAASRAIAGGVDERLVRRMVDGGTAVVADIGPPIGPVLAFRFDMDALPIEESDSPEHLPCAQGFGSQNNGLMHACGHDGHVAIGLALAAELAQVGDSLKVKVRLIFQPAEEGTPGGAEAIVDRGLIDDVRYMVCCHLGLGLRTGVVASRSSFLATSKYRVGFRGTEAHVTANPQCGRNALLAAASAALALHAIPPDGDGWSSLNVGVLRAGDASGITPAWATMELGYWADTTDIHDRITDKVRQVIKGSAETWGVDAEQRLIGRAPNSPQSEALAAIVRECASCAPAVNEVKESVALKAGEDGNVFLKKVADEGGHGVYIAIGSDTAAGHHSPQFDFDEESLKIGVSLLRCICFRLPDRILESQERYESESGIPSAGFGIVADPSGERAPTVDSGQERWVTNGTHSD